MSEHINITSYVEPEAGWFVMYYCPFCHVSTIMLHPWAIKPTGGDYHRILHCPNFGEHNLLRWLGHPPIAMDVMPRKAEN
jgi:hypothetical protein